MSMRLDFLQNVVGAEGAKALAKAVDREPALGGALELRAIIGWVSCLDAYEATIPGTTSQLRLNKSEETYTGSVDDYSFENESLYHVSAAVANALELEPGHFDRGLHSMVLSRLGKSLDLLIKSQLSKKVLDPTAGYQITHEHHDLGDGEMLTQINAMHGGKRVGWALMTHQGANLHPDDVNVDPEHRRRGLASAMYAHAERVTGKRILPSAQQQAPGQALWQGNAQKQQFGVALVTKGEALGAGPANPPRPQEAPMAAVPPTAVQSTSKKVSKIPSLPLTRSEATAECPLCGGEQMSGNKFVGCICFAELAKSVKTTAYGDGYVLDFGADVGVDEVRSLVAALKG